MANSTLNRTFGTPTHADKWTWSAWIKRSKLCTSGVYMDVFAGYTDGNNYAQLSFHPDNYFFYYDYQGGAVKASLATNRLFLDTNAWYHIVVATDTTQGTAADRVKLYINGEQYTWDRTTTYPNQNQDTKINNASTPHYIGQVGVGNFFDGYMSHVAFVDGTQLTPTSFGGTDATSGIWKFKAPSGVTWGTNGAHLKFENSANLGLDSSGQSNNFTVNGNLRQSINTPSNVYPSVNHLRRFNAGGEMAYSNAGTTITGPGSGWQMIGTATGVTTGKWYYEYKITTLGYQNGYHKLGFFSNFITDIGNNGHLAEAAIDGGYAFYCQNGNLEVRTDDAVISGYAISELGVSFSNNDYMCLAIDMTNKRAYFRKNGDAWIKSGDPVNGTNGLDISSDYTAGKYLIPAGSIYYAGVGNFNFGNGYFGTTAVASAGTSSSGDDSVWEFDCPTGYYGINTKNINTYG